MEEREQTISHCESGTGGCNRGQEEKGAWIIAGAVLLGSLMIAASVLVSEKPKGGSTTVTPTAPTAAQPGTQPVAQPSVTLEQVQGLLNGKNISFGNKKSKLIFVEFSDPSCPYCHVAAGKNPSLNKQFGSKFVLVKDGGSYVAPVPEMKKLVDAGKAGFVWLYANGHGNGELATKALYCAHEKGKFWEVHDLLMNETGYSLINNDVKNDVAKAGTLAEFLKSAVSVSDMKSCLESGKYDGRIAEDMAVAQQFGFRGTPSFFVNQTNYPGAVSFKDMQAVIDKELK